MMYKTFLLTVALFYSSALFSQENFIRIDKITPNATRTHTLKINDKVKISTTNLRNKERFATARITSITDNIITFEPINSNFNTRITPPEHIRQIGIKSKSRIAISALTYVAAFAFTLTTGNTAFFTYANAYKIINFDKGRWILEIIPAQHLLD